jgi:GNAT superfamily N-acetyltransferase
MVNAIGGRWMTRAQMISRRIRRNLEDYGLGITIRKCLVYGLVYPFYRRTSCLVYRLKLNLLPQVAIPDHGPFTFRSLEPYDEITLAAVEGQTEWLKGTLSRRLVEGDLCIVALDGKNLAGFNLVSLDTLRIPLIKLERPLRRDRAWSEQITVLPAYRHRGLAVLLRKVIAQELHKRGFKFFYGAAIVSNPASMRLAKSAGFDPVGTITYARFLGRERFRLQRIRSWT